VIRLSLSASQALAIESVGVTLRGVQPVLNGASLPDYVCEVIQAERDHIELHFTAAALAGGTLGLKASHADAAGHLWVQYWVAELPEDLVLDSFGLRFEKVENLRQYLRNGYFSWDGSYYVQPDTLPNVEKRDSRVETGYAMCQLLPRYGDGCLILGFDRHDRFQQTFSVDTSQQPPSLTVQTLWDRKDRTALERCESERLVIFAHQEIEGGLREWARLVAGASPTPPRLSAPPITGWCSWYNLYAYISEENILDHLHAAQVVAAR
jgi:alpha-galactosidase